MPYSSRYKDQECVKMGKGSLNKLVEVLLRIDAANYTHRKPEREEMLQTLNVFGGETQRLSAVLRFFIINVGSEPWVPFGTVMAFWTNHWANLGDGIMRVVLALLAKSTLKKEDAEIEAELHMSKAELSLSAFKNEDIPVTRKDFLGKVEMMLSTEKEPMFLTNKTERTMFSRFVSDEIGIGNVLGADEDENSLSLPLLMSYIMLIKHEKLLVPELILREELYTALKNKGETRVEAGHCSQGQG